MISVLHLCSMIWISKQQFHDWPFDKEVNLEAAIGKVKATLFGESRLEDSRHEYERRCVNGF
jgi:hypothetical protein